MKILTTCLGCLLLLELSACNRASQAPTPENIAETQPISAVAPATRPSPATSQSPATRIASSTSPSPTTGKMPSTRRSGSSRINPALVGVVRQWHMRAARPDEKLDQALAQSFTPEIEFVANLNLPGPPFTEITSDHEKARSKGFGLDLPKQIEPGDRFFGLATVKVPKAGPAMLTIGSDLRQVYINGQQVWSDPQPANHDRKQTITVNLQEGDCRIAIEAGTEFFLSLTDPQTGRDATLRAPTWPANTADTRNDGNGVDGIDFLDRHEQFVAIARSGKARIIFIGDSITQNWAHEGRETWNSVFVPMGAVDFGYGGDESQHILWRLRNGELEGANPELAVLLIGSNNVVVHYYDHTAEQIANGVELCVKEFQKRTPATKLLLLGILPRQADIDPTCMARIAKTNELISKLADGKQIFYMDIGKAFVTADGNVNTDLLPDRTHPNAEGYVIFAQQILPTIKQLLGEK